MAKQKSNYSGSGELSTILGPDASFEGHLKSGASMRLDGKAKGEIESSETVTIGLDGAVEGDVTARDIIVGGKIQGTLSASGKIVLESTSVLNGDLKTARLVIEEGAVFNGSSDMGGSQRIQPQHPPREINLSEE